MFEICAGDLDRRIVIQSNTPSKNGTGEEVESWGTFATVWAAKRDLRGKEDFEGQQQQARIFTEFKIRYLSGLQNDMRISYDSKIYDIEGIQEIGRKEGYIITTRAKVS